MSLLLSTKEINRKKFGLVLEHQPTNSNIINSNRVVDIILISTK
nr:MAG TPA: hypothetical protein [Bacteriophage sp.]